MKLLRKHILIFAVVFIVIGCYAFLNISCPFKRIFNTVCPACGTVHAILSLIKLDFNGYLYYNVLAVPLVVGVFLATHRNSLFEKHKGIVGAIVIFIAVVAFLCMLFNKLQA